MWFSPRNESHDCADFIESRLIPIACKSPSPHHFSELPPTIALAINKWIVSCYPLDQVYIIAPPNILYYYCVPGISLPSGNEQHENQRPSLVNTLKK